ncbi:MAG: amino acid adenylation domain-containing protein [Pleurocapsa sp. CRU_1_2]|nr:amino acid adenylation domain-containing protein [Pleurocapsa sp. CRU_1_2]
MDRTDSQYPTALSVDDFELLDYLLEDDEIELPQTLKISRRENLDPAPLSYAQSRLWFLEQLESESGVYNTGGAVRLVGVLDVAALAASLNEIVQRHEILRTTFAIANGQPIQVIAPTLTVTLPVIDLQQLPDQEREKEVQRLAIQEADRPFDLTEAPLLRVTLLKLGQTEHILLLTMHHIVFDGWSREVLVRELATLYENFSRGKYSPLPELPIQYADFAHWQRQRLQGEVLEQQLTYWKQKLADAPTVLELFTDRPRPAVQTFRGSTQFFELSPSLTQKLKQLSQKQGVTLFMTLLAAFQTLLYRYTNQKDICIGSPIANRNCHQIEPLIGFFVNTLVLRTDLSGNPSFQQLLDRVRQVALDAYAHQDLPFEVLVEQLQPERSLSYTPLFQVMFSLENAPSEPFALPGLTFDPLELDTGIAKFDLTLSMEETQQGLKGRFEYNTDLFDARRMTRTIEHWQNLLEVIVAAPEQRISELPLLSEAEQHQLLVEWNDTWAEYPLKQCIHQLFEEQVERSPDAVAVVYKDERLTYQELNSRANQLARYLKKLGVGSEILVGICVERSLEMIIGILGILKAGGAYVPLDPAYPKQRLVFMLRDAQVPVLLTQQSLLDVLSEHKAKFVCLDTDWKANAYGTASPIATESQENLVNQTQSENLAYAIYTSGSTGTPKGVAIQHDSLVNYTETVCLEYELKPSDRILQFASIGFDVAAEEIFPCLVRGATLVLRTDEMLSSIPDFLQQCHCLGVTVLDLPTAFWHQLASQLTATMPLPETLRLVIIGSESALPDRLKIWQQQVGQRVRLVNIYGPTETTIGATLCDLSRSIADETTVPIGRPIRNVQAYILDSYLQLVPVGVPGELYIGGVGVARGYLNQPELTIERFIPNPFEKSEVTKALAACSQKSEVNSQFLLPTSYFLPPTLYKTGDLARYRLDGNIEFLGRIDRQVKIRGFRIELEEIEAVMSQHPGIRETAIVVREDRPGNKCLVAYLVHKPQQTLTITELRSFLKEKLPEYMVPSIFMQLDALPLTPNGKVDRRSLPEPEQTRDELETAYVAPRTPLEQQLAEIWAQVLGIETVGIHDNFFALGGHSLLITQLFAQMRDTFKVNLSLRGLFKEPTVANVAETIEIAQQSKSGGEIPTEDAINLKAEAVLDPTIHPGGVTYNPDVSPSVIFLTGATGFLGSFLLYELLQQTQADIYCLVRAETIDLGKQKILSSLKSYLLWNESFSQRIIPEIGDLSKPLLGLSEALFQQLAGQVDVIYHNGALVNSTYPYSVLKAANVIGTQEVLRLASLVKIKPVHFISTIGVIGDGKSSARIVREQDSLDNFIIPSGGYSQSKWVAEKLVAIARERGIPVSIYRPGSISGHSKTGTCNTSDNIYRTIKGCIQLGSVSNQDIQLDLSPVDYISQAIVHLSRQKESLEKTFHLVNPQPLPLSEMVNYMRSLGYPIERVSDTQWRSQLLNEGNSPDNALYPLLSIFQRKSAIATPKIKTHQSNSSTARIH